MKTVFTYSTTRSVFLCRECLPEPKEVYTLAIFERECAACGDLAGNIPSTGLKRGDLVSWDSLLNGG